VPLVTGDRTSPTWLDLYRRRETLETGEQVVSLSLPLTDFDDWIRRGEDREGYKPVMPTFKGLLAAPEAAASSNSSSHCAARASSPCPRRKSVL